MINGSASSDQIKRWIGNQKYIGDDPDGNYVIEGLVELLDGRQLLAWTIQKPSQLVPHTEKDGTTGFFARKDFGYVTFLKPSIKKQQA